MLGISPLLAVTVVGRRRLGTFIVDTRSLPLSEWLAKLGRSGEQLFKGKFPNSAMLAVRIDFVGSSARYADLNG